jgi:hypothetical protein
MHASATHGPSRNTATHIAAIFFMAILLSGDREIEKEIRHCFFEEEI